MFPSVVRRSFCFLFCVNFLLWSVTCFVSKIKLWSYSIYCIMTVIICNVARTSTVGPILRIFPIDWDSIGSETWNFTMFYKMSVSVTVCCSSNSMPRGESYLTANVCILITHISYICWLHILWTWVYIYVDHRNNFAMQWQHVLGLFLCMPSRANFDQQLVILVMFLHVFSLS